MKTNIPSSTSPPNEVARQSVTIYISPNGLKAKTNKSTFRLPKQYIPYFNPLFFHLLGYRGVQTTLLLSSNDGDDFIVQSGGGLYEWLFSSNEPKKDVSATASSSYKYTFPFRLFLPLYYLFPSFSKTYRPPDDSDSNASGFASGFFLFQSPQSRPNEEEEKKKNKFAPFSYFQSLASSLFSSFSSTANPTVIEEKPEEEKPEEKKLEEQNPEDEGKPQEEEGKSQLEENTEYKSLLPTSSVSTAAAAEENDTQKGKVFDITRWKSLPDPTTVEITFFTQDLHPAHPRILRHKRACQQYGCHFVFDVAQHTKQ